MGAGFFLTLNTFYLLAIFFKRLPDAYITIHGESYDAIIKGEEGKDTGHIFGVQHSYYRLDRFTIDGKLDDETYVDKCLYVQTSRDHGEKAKEIEFNGHSFR